VLVTKLGVEIMQGNYTRNRGFTLIEMSIVLVIIGLVIGGVIAGKSLIQRARIHNLASEIQQMRMSVNAFVMQYDMMPGDLVNAGDYWPSCASPSSLCNGNGDGVVNSSEEKYRSWQHMSLAGTLEGNYTGEPNGSGRCEIDVNTPGSTIKGGGYMFQTFSFSGWNIRFENGLQFGSRQNVSLSACLDYAVVSPVDAFGVDKKLDEGTANNGKIVSLNGTESGNTGCLINQGTDNNYDLADDNVACRMFVDLKPGS